ncbi:hypothetical protein Taro_048898 [Colocasia esculenta]|uniref:Uncharacterized protein n=1 Tax=Colocasia esculenta TaxID=4460 RepID=A0A843X9D6_COLES|nr:hypothetical protein [Colocasia esculenta]
MGGFPGLALVFTDAPPVARASALPLDAFPGIRCPPHCTPPTLRWLLPEFPSPPPPHRRPMLEPPTPLCGLHRHVKGFNGCWSFPHPPNAHISFSLDCLVCWHLPAQFNIAITEFSLAFPPPLSSCLICNVANWYDPRKRITAAQALEHEYFRLDPLPGRNVFSALVPSQPGEKVLSYPARPVDHTTDLEGSTNVQASQQVSSGNAVGVGVASVVNPRGVPRAMPMVGMQRMPAPGMGAYGMPSQPGMGNMHASGMTMQRAAAAQAAHQQQLRRKDPGMGMQNPGYPQQKPRRG